MYEYLFLLIQDIKMCCAVIGPSATIRSIESCNQATPYITRVDISGKNPAVRCTCSEYKLLLALVPSVLGRGLGS